MKNILFGERCSLWWCFKRPDMYLQIGAGPFKVHHGYCERHVKIIDEMCRNGEISNVNPHNYTPL